MNKISQIEKVRDEITQARVHNKTIGFVPTMGFLHRGHLSLIEKARAECDFVIVSIFVNPTQFGEGEDLDRYPRDIDADTSLCENAGVDILFHPAVEEMYPTHDADNLLVSYPDLSKKLCGKFRPGHFDGVTTIMSKLLTIISPDKCYMGKKDGQQLIILNRLIHDSFFPVSLIGCPTIREADGLALSSRNEYLTADQRREAAEINNNLKIVAESLSSGNGNIEEALTQAIVRLEDHELTVQYFDYVDIETLESVRTISPGSYLLCAAVMCGTTRLIDNYSVIVTSQGACEIDRGIKIQLSDSAHV